MNNNQNPTKIKQHYVSRFYLKRFVNLFGMLEVLHLASNEFGNPKRPKSVAYAENFYKLRGEPEDEIILLERGNSILESGISRVLPIVEHNLMQGCTLTVPEMELLKILLSSLYLSGIGLRNNILNTPNEKLLKLYFIRAFTDGDFESYSRLVEDMESPEGKLAFARETQVAYMANIEKYYDAVAPKNMQVYISRTDAEFVTSDNPSFAIPPLGSTLDLNCLDFEEYWHQFALTPKILIRVYPNTNSRLLACPLPSIELYDKKRDRQIIAEANLICAHNAVNYLYAQNRTPLEEIKKINPIAWKNLKVS